MPTVTKFRIKPEYQGMIITVNPWPKQESITLDLSKPIPSEHLFNYWKFQEFRKYIESYEVEENEIPAMTPYKGIEHNKTKTSNGKEETPTQADSREPEGDSEGTGIDDVIG